MWAAAAVDPAQFCKITGVTGLDAGASGTEPGTAATHASRRAAS